MPGLNFIHLVPPLLEQGNTEELMHSGRTLGTTLSPRDDSLATYVAPNTSLASASSGEQAYWADIPLYFASTHQPPDSVRREFISEAGMVFDLLAALRKEGELEGYGERIDEPAYQVAMHAKCKDLVNVAETYWLRASHHRPDEQLQYDSEHYRTLYTCLSLAGILYAPRPEWTRLPVGDDLMEWLNMHYIAPSTEEGDHLSNQNSPWEDETFWPYLTRAVLRGLTKASIFFLEVLSRHPSSSLQDISQKLIPLLQSHPRVRDYTSTQDFSRALPRWKEKVRILRIELGLVPESHREDTLENWWDRISDILSILEGRYNIIKHVCEELGADWKEICAAYAMFVQPTLNRSDLPEVAAEILEEMPPDPTDVEDAIHVALIRAQSRESLACSARLDPWLAAHLAIVMELLAYLTNDRNEESELSITEYYLLSYAEYLRADPGLWRWNVSYLCSCGDIGKKMADEVLVRVPLKLGLRNERPSGSMTADQSPDADKIQRRLKELVQVCQDYERMTAMRMICKIGADELAKSREYALAMEYYVKAEDWPGLGQCVDLILEEFITGGPEKFILLVNDMASLLQDITNIPDAPGIFIHRLTFAVRYAEFHDNLASEHFQDAALSLEKMFQQDTVPKSWWALLLCDCVDLLQHDPLLFSTAVICLFLQKLEEIQMRVEQGWVDGYLGVIARTTKGGETKDAFQRLKRVRLAIARYYAKCSIVDVGGKGSASLRSPKL